MIDELLAGARTPEEITGPEGAVQRLTKRLSSRAMDVFPARSLGRVMPESGQYPIPPDTFEPERVRRDVL